MSQTKIIAHRGASADAPENTLESVLLAWEQNADAVEVDIQLTADGEIVIFHDENTLRMTGVPGLLKDKTWAEIRQLEIHAKGYTTHIPLLRAVLPTIPRDKFLVTELKSGPEIIAPLRKLMDEFHIAPHNVQIISLIEESIRQAFIDFPGYETQRVFEFLGEQPDIDYLLRYAAETPFSGIDLEMGDYITDAFVQKIHGVNKKIYVWTVDELSDARYLKKIKIDGITTNRPDYLHSALEAVI